MKNDIHNTTKGSPERSRGAQYEIRDTKRYEILVADDEQIIRDLFEKFLAKQGYKVSTAMDGLETFNKVKKENYDMLLLDLKMPGMGGMKILKKIKKLDKDLIIIIMTGYATVNTAKEAIKQGCFDYITKPFDIGNVGVIIRKAFEVRKLAEEERKLETQLQRAEKLALLGQMGADVAHEVNTVLTSTKLFLEMLQPKLSAIEEDSNAGMVLEELIRAEKLIKRFSAFTKPGEPEFIEADINTIMRKSLQFLKFRFDKQKVEVIDKLDQKLPHILCDPVNMEEVFLNILSNSIDAMPAGGILVVKSEFAGENVAVTISDNGEGITAENIPKLYNPFFTTRIHGTGLGLSIAHRIIDQHKGLIEINSEENKGTDVRIELPFSTDDRR